MKFLDRIHDRRGKVGTAFDRLGNDRFGPLIDQGFHRIGTALPVLIFAFLHTFQIHRLGKAFAFFGRIDAWLRTGAGVLFILVGRTLWAMP